MPIRFLAALFALLILPAQALQTESLDDDTLIVFGSTLGASASASQWQQLWQRTRQAGHFTAGPGRPHFTLPSRDIPALVTLTLTQAHSVGALKRTQAWYRHDFSPQTIGEHSGVPLTAICIWVDWRSVAEGTRSTDAAALGQASLLLTKPCA
ncbi:hypothetical protein [Pseudomonas sp. R5(2019)]|uniref:hypothetical protein n=1 Tax=Pseudomonas sp. R5(2019) TaxID=2697566 RepID=UPI001412CF8E|nr:hypothetical protein [Pseudomonas sp. R5(2019)]NBA98505.1 hypothetical protein [Pseudomonas sp. R5(2019)]